MRYTIFETELIGPLTLVGDDMGLRHIQFATSRRPLHIPSEWGHDTRFFKEAMAQLKAYFKGERRQFDLPLAPQGTDFQLAVWRILRTIPYGEVASYQWVAGQVGNSRAVRAVGGANGKNPLPIVVPCHRVIGSNGTLTGFGGGLDVKQRLIELEKKAGTAHRKDGAGTWRAMPPEVKPAAR